jgi:hypothetical protein
MKHTAVQWLEIVLIWDPISEEEFEHNMNCWKQAKEMEKEQMIDFAFKYGDLTTRQIADSFDKEYKTNEK